MSNQWSLIQAYFHNLIDLSAEEQQQALQKLKATLPEIYQEVYDLIQESDQSHPLLLTGEGGAWYQKMNALVGTSMGPYKLTKLIGKGGMGAVYLAERSDGAFDRNVALKLIQPERFSEGLLAHFKKERQTLARLNHPNIASLYDGGREGEQLYFTMEYVEGGNLLHYIEKHKCTLKTRLKLFITIAEAISYAHQQLVLHLDIKPENILVDEEGAIKVLDFGVAELINSNQEDHYSPLTIAYAAPERLNGQQLSTYNDVYSLGVLLYQLLAGTMPYTEEVYQSKASLQAALQQEVALPSTKAKTLEKQYITGDLDCICQKAIANSTEKRYQSVEQVIKDCEAYLENRPISLNQSSSYRIRKYFQRNSSVTSIIAIALVAIIGLVGFYTFKLQKERDIAVDESIKTRQLMGLMTDAFNAANPRISQGDTVTARTILQRATVRMDSQLQNQPELRAEMSVILSEIYGVMSNYKMGDSLAQKAVDLYIQFPPDDPAKVGHAYFNLGVSRYFEAKYDAAQRDFEYALEILLPIENRNGGRDRNGNENGNENENENKNENRNENGNRNENEKIADCYAMLGNLAIELSQLDRADSLHQLALQMKKRIFSPPHLQIADSYHALGDIARRSGDVNQAEKYYLESLNMKQALFDPPNTEIAYSMNHLSGLYYQLGKYDEGLSLAKDSYQQRKTILGENNIETQASLNNMAVMHQMLGQLDSSLMIRLRLLAVVEDIYKGELHPNILFSYISLGQIYYLKEDYTASENAFRKADSMSEKLAFKSMNPLQAGVFKHRLAKTLMKQNKWNTAIPFLKEAQSIWATVPSQKWKADFDLGKSYLAIQEKIKAREALLAARAYLEQSPEEYEAQLQEMDALLGE